MATAKTHAQLVDAAIADGRISAASRQVFLNALTADPGSTKRALAALTPLPVNLQRSGKQPNASATTPSTARPSVDSDALTPMFRRDLGVPNRGDMPATRAFTVTTEQMNAQANANPQLHRIAWELGIRDGLNKPSDDYIVWPNDDIPGSVHWVDQGNGTGHFETVRYPELP
jgi:hypothetical protein